VCRTRGLRLDDFAWLARWYRRCSDDLIVYSGSDKHKLRYKQHAQLVGIRSGGHCHHSGDIHLRIAERLDECEPHLNDHLHPYCDQCLWLGHIHGKSDRNSVERFIGDHNHRVSRRNTRRGICGLHNRRQRRFSALHLFRKHQCRFSSFA
jgi:hypothetical protein